MAIEDKKALREMMRCVHKVENVDFVEAKFAVARNIATIAGVIRPLVAFRGSIRDVVSNMVDNIKRVPEIHEIFMEAKIESTAKRTKAPTS